MKDVDFFLIKNVWKSSANGIQVDDSTISNIHDNTISSFHKRGIRYINSNGKFYDNEVIGDSVDGTNRVQNLVNLWGGSNVEIYENKLHNALTNPEGTPTWDSPGIFVSSYGGSSNSDAYIHDNEIYDCDSGIVITSVCAEIDTSSATINNNNLHNLENAIIFEKTTGSAVISGNTFTNNINNFDPSINIGDTYYGGIQYAIDNANSGDTVYVSPGLYNERITINKPLTLRGATYNINKNGYEVPENYEWDTSVESVINNPEPALSTSQVVDIVSDDIVFVGFVAFFVSRKKRY